jgi:hypothetical protein
MWQFANLRFAYPYFCDLRICDLWLCDLRILFLTDLKLPQIRKYIIFNLTNISLKCSHSNLRTTFNNMEFRSLKYSYEGKENIRGILYHCGPGLETLLFFLQMCGFAICGLGHQGSLWINHYKCAD